jgi:aminoglycoside phosphotransferase family enzyme
MTRERDPSAVSLAEKVEFLTQPKVYPEPANRVEAIETHRSWVFLTDQHAYKMKKPARTDFLDFSTLEARHRYCEEEVRLNRRLARDVYLGTVALTVGRDDALHIGGHGRVVERLVKMRRLRADQMLDRMIKAGTVEDADIRALGLRLARFYREAVKVPIDPSAYAQRFAKDIEANLDVLATAGYGVPADLARTVAAELSHFLDRERALLDQRARENRIVEAHGDLRPEHIVLRPQPLAIDCLEFNRDFRTLDPVEELAYLAIECEFLGDSTIGPRILAVYADATGDVPADALVQFYASVRAFLRAKLAVWHIADLRKGHNEAMWANRAIDYLRLAHRHVCALGRD